MRLQRNRRPRANRPVGRRKPLITLGQLLNVGEDFGQPFMPNGFVFEQFRSEPVEHVTVAVEHPPCFLLRVLEQRLHLAVNQVRGLVRVWRTLRARVRRVAIVITELDGTNGVRHSVFGDHLARRLGRLLDVVGCTRGRVVEHDLFGNPPAHRIGELVKQLIARHRVFVFQRHNHGVSQGFTARQNGDLRYRVGVTQRCRSNRVPTLVVRGDQLLLIVHHAATTLRTGDNPVDGFVNRARINNLCVHSRSEQGRLVQHVREVSTGESGGLAGNDGQVDIVGNGLALGMHHQDAATALEVWRVDPYLTVKSTGTQQCRIQHIRTVRCSDQNHVRVRVEPVHLNEQLVQRLFAFVVTAAETNTALATNRVDLVDEDNRGRILLGLFEQVTHTTRTDTDEHLNEVRARNRVERHSGLAGNSLCEQGLTGSRRSVQQHTLRDAGTNLLELRGFLQELLNFSEFLERLIGSGDISEGNLRVFLRHQLGARLAKLHDTAGATALHPGHHDPNKEHDEHDREQQRQRSGQPVRAGHLVVEVTADLGVIDRLHHRVGARINEVEVQSFAVLFVRFLELHIDPVVAGDNGYFFELLIFNDRQALLGGHLGITLLVDEAEPDTDRDDGYEHDDDRALHKFLQSLHERALAPFRCAGDSLLVTDCVALRAGTTTGRAQTTQCNSRDSTGRDPLNDSNARRCAKGERRLHGLGSPHE